MTIAEAAEGKSTDPASELRDLRQFFFTVLLILCPVFLLYGLTEALAWRIGETVPPKEIAQWQATNHDRIWRGGDARSYLFYKLARTLLLRPEVLVLGQSRVNSLQAQLFAPYTFYNASMAAFTFSHYISFLQRITAAGYAPRVLFCNFDYWMFSKEFDRSGNWGDRFYDEPPTHWEDLKAVIDVLAQRPFHLIGQLSHTDEAKGIYAVANGTGFRWDGDLQSPQPSADPDHLEFENDQIEVGRTPLLLDDHMARSQIENFTRFMELARSHHISVVGVQFPFYARIIDSLNSNPNAGIWRQFQSPQMRQFFESQGMIFFDFADFPPYRDQPQHFVDSLHPDAVLDEIVVKRVLADPRVRTLLPRTNGG